MSDSAQNRWWTRVDRALRRLETGLIVVILSGLMLLGGMQIVLRNLFSIGLAWGDGLGRLAVLWLALLGALAASRDGRHIAIGAVTRWLPQRWRVVAGVCADAFAAAVSATLAWASFAFVADSREFGERLLGDVPAWWLQASMPFVFALIAWRFLVRLLLRRSLSGPKETPL